MDRFGPTGKVSKKLVHILRWTTFPGRTGRNFGWMDRVSSSADKWRNLGRDPFNQNFRKFRFKTQWIVSVQPETFRKNGSTFWGGPIFPVGPVGISVEWIAPLESSTNVEFRIRDGLGLFYMGSYITFHCIVCHYIPCEFSGLLRWDHYQPVRLLVTGIQKNKQSKIKTELVTVVKFFEGWFRFIRRWRRRKWRKVLSCEYRWHISKVQINPRRLGKDPN